MRCGMFLTSSYFIVGLALLYGGAEGLVRRSASLAMRLGLTRLVIGLTIVAVGTSLPELATSVVASVKKEGGYCCGQYRGI